MASLISSCPCPKMQRHSTPGKFTRNSAWRVMRQKLPLLPGPDMQAFPVSHLLPSAPETSPERAVSLPSASSLGPSHQLFSTQVSLFTPQKTPQQNKAAVPTSFSSYCLACFPSGHSSGICIFGSDSLFPSRHDSVPTKHHVPRNVQGCP